MMLRNTAGGSVTWLRLFLTKQNMHPSFKAATVLCAKTYI